MLKLYRFLEQSYSNKLVVVFVLGVVISLCGRLFLGWPIWVVNLSASALLGFIVISRIFDLLMGIREKAEPERWLRQVNDLLWTVALFLAVVSFWLSFLVWLALVLFIAALVMNIVVGIKMRELKNKKKKRRERDNEIS